MIYKANDDLKDNFCANNKGLDIDYDFLMGDDALFHYTTAETGICKILATNKIRFLMLDKCDENNERIIRKTLPAQNIGLYNIKCLSFCSNNQKIAEFNVIGNHINQDKEIYVNSNNKTKTHNKKIINSLHYLLPRYGFLKHRMWDQYGDKDSGVCLVFSKNELIKTISSIENLERTFILGDLVEYSDKPFSMKTINIDRRLSEKDKRLSEKDKQLFDKKKLLLRDVVLYHFTKSMDFRDENEFRIAINTVANEDYFFDYGNSLKGIILGDRFENNDTSKCKKALIEKYRKGKGLFIYTHKYKRKTNGREIAEVLINNDIPHLEYY